MLCSYSVHTLRETFDDLDGHNPMNWRAREIALDIGRSVVSLSTWTENKMLFACSGLIIGWDDTCATILTSGTLVTESTSEDRIMLRISTVEEQVEEVFEYLHDHLYNIALIKMKLKKEPHVAKLDVAGWPTSEENVLSVGRHVTSKLMGSHGSLLPGHYKLNCLLSSCKTTKGEEAGVFLEHRWCSGSLLLLWMFMTGIGGPLVSTNTKHIIGVNFYAKDDTPFVPAGIVLRCLKQLNYNRKVNQPELGMTLEDLAHVELFELEKLQQDFTNIHGVQVASVVKGLPAKVAGIEVGGIISFLDGYKVHSVLQFFVCCLMWLKSWKVR